MKNFHSIPKVCGADVELANFILGRPQNPGDRAAKTAGEAANRLLQEVSGISQYSFSMVGWGGNNNGQKGGEKAPTGTKKGSSKVQYNPQDVGRKFLPQNGGCIYIDLDHLELCIPEVRSARDHLTGWLAMVEIAREARERAQEKLPEGEELQVLANNSDGFGKSYGSHLNFLITADCLENILHRKADHLLYLATFLSTSILFTGQGKVGRENGAAPADFQISQRADFFETLLGVQTTYKRPMVNSRDESHCTLPYLIPGREDLGLSRLHVIFFDTNLCHVAHYLKVGATQLVLAMLEQDWPIKGSHILKSPVEALPHISRNLDLTKGLPILSDGKATALEIQKSVLEEVSRFVASGLAEGIVEGAEEIVNHWAFVLDHLERRNWEELAPCIDWVLKRRIIEEWMEKCPQINWSSPEVKYLDHLYSSLDKDQGLFSLMLDQGVVKTLVEEKEVRHFMENPPKDTRAYLRSRLLKKMGEALFSMDWGWMRFQLPNLQPIFVDLSHPLEATARDYEKVLKEEGNLLEWLRALEERVYFLQPFDNQKKNTAGAR